MDLDEWLWRKKITMREFSERTGIHWNMLSGIKRKVRVPRLDNAIIIHKMTNGEVTFEQLLTPDLQEKVKKIVAS